MESNYSTLFSLLRAAVYDNHSSLPHENDWGAIVVLAAKHGVGALAWDGLMRLREKGAIAANLLPPSTIKLRWIAIVQYAERNYMRQQSAMMELDNALAQKKQRMLAFKGMALGLYYPIPNHRECCDIDIYTLSGNHAALYECIKQAGGIIDHDDPKHLALRYKGVWLEIHRHFLWKFASRKVRMMNDYLVSTLNNAKSLLGYSCIYKPSLEFDGLFVLIHAANHFKSEGLMIRHVIDWVLVLQASGYRWNEVKLRKYGLLQFASILNRIACEHLGFNIPQEICNCNDEVYKRVLYDILYPQYEAEHHTSVGNLVNRKYKRFTSRKWVYPLVGDNFWHAALSSAVEHILDPWSLFRGHK